jgi:hypothetical protein
MSRALVQEPPSRPVTKPADAPVASSLPPATQVPFAVQDTDVTIEPSALGVIPGTGWAVPQVPLTSVTTKARALLREPLTGTM